MRMPQPMSGQTSIQPNSITMVQKGRWKSSSIPNFPIHGRHPAIAHSREPMFPPLLLVQLPRGQTPASTCPADSVPAPAMVGTLSSDLRTSHHQYYDTAVRHRPIPCWINPATSLTRKSNLDVPAPTDVRKPSLLREVTDIPNRQTSEGSARWPQALISTHSYSREPCQS